MLALAQLIVAYREAYAITARTSRLLQGRIPYITQTFEHGLFPDASFLGSNCYSVLSISRDLMSSVFVGSIHGTCTELPRRTDHIATKSMSRSAYVSGDVDGDYLINEVAGNWDVCTYGEASRVLDQLLMNIHACRPNRQNRSNPLPLLCT